MAGSLRLGLTREQVVKRLGPSNEARPTKLVFRSHAKVPMTQQQTARFGVSSPGEASFDRIRAVAVMLQRGRVVTIDASEVTSY